MEAAETAEALAAAKSAEALDADDAAEVSPVWLSRWGARHSRQDNGREARPCWGLGAPEHLLSPRPASPTKEARVRAAGPAARLCSTLFKERALGAGVVSQPEQRTFDSDGSMRREVAGQRHGNVSELMHPPAAGL